MISLLKNAMETGERLELIYMNWCGGISQRTIKVLAVHEHSFTAYCDLRRKIRTFKFENVLGIARLRKIKKGA